MPPRRRRPDRTGMRSGVRSARAAGVWALRSQRLHRGADDAAETAAVVAARGIDLLVVDHYGLDWNGSACCADRSSIWWSWRTWKAGSTIAACCSTRIPRTVRSKILPRAIARGRDGVRGTAIRAAGQGYRDVRLTRKAPKESVLRIVVSFGASDPLDLTLKSVEALLLPQFADLHADVVIGANYRGLDRLELLVRDTDRIHLVPPQPQLGDLLQRADLAIGAGGVTALERLCLGLPSLLWSSAWRRISDQAASGSAGPGPSTIFGPAANIDVQQLEPDCSVAGNQRVGEPRQQRLGDG